MNDKSRFRMLWLLVLLVVAYPSAAEVGVILDDPIHRPHDGRPYVQTIVDDPEPIGRWRRWSPLNDSRRVVLNTDGDGRGDGAPAVVYHAAWDRSIVVWARNTVDGTKIVASQFAAGAWTAPRRINDTTGVQQDPTMAIADDGTLVLAYWAADAGDTRVFFQTLGGRDDDWSTPVPVSTAGVIACRPSVVVHQGATFVAYETHPNGADQTPKEIQLAELNGGIFVEQLVSATTHAGPMWPQVHSRLGKLWVDWIDYAQAPFDGEMAWSEQVGANWSPVELEPFLGEEELEFFVRGEIGAEVTDPQSADTTGSGSTP